MNEGVLDAKFKMMLLRSMHEKENLNLLVTLRRTSFERININKHQYITVYIQ